ncbi:MAG: DUF6702 family protein [Saprospiraceae bacterium]|jgi:hypothetical protein
MWITLFLISNFWKLEYTPLLSIDHDFHISKCLVEYKPESSTFQISLHLFIDDLEQSMALEGRDSLFLLTAKESPIAELSVSKFLEEHFKIEVNGHPVTYEYLGKETAGDYIAMWCYMEVTKVPYPTQITIYNDLLLNIFEDQKNIITVIGPDEKKAVMIMQRGDEMNTVKF